MYGTYILIIPIIVMWLGYVATIITFKILWQRDVATKDNNFIAYLDHH